MKRFTCLFFCVYTFTAFSQSLTLPRNFLHSYAAGIRTENGKPGANYWQNTASYNIAVSFSPKERIVAGTEDIIYTNNSPDTLTEIWFKLYPNLYQTGAPRETAIKPQDINTGVRIEKMTIDNVQKLNDDIVISNTNMHVNIAPLLPGKTIKFSLTFSYVLNKTSHNRTGMIHKEAAFIAYFFPRIAVYDDIDGWNKNAYTGKQEFYNDFCRFNVAVTVPSDYIVCATGNLLNAAEVYAPGIVQKIKTAEQSDGITKVIDTADLRAGNVTMQSSETNTWKFEANDVTDFVFAISNHYIWYASSLEVDAQTRRRTRVDAVFNPAHKSYFNVVEYARKTVQVMSYTFPAWPFPYPHETVFDGLDQMEYPMMVNDNPLEDKADDIELTDHEIFHTMFPFYMGINETKYAWMDEGWATIGEWLISPLIDSSIADDYGIMPTNFFSGKDVDVPIVTLSTQLDEVSYFINSYPKPALAYLYVKDLLGDELFKKALHYYISQWHGKHPAPFDFFNCMNTGSGKNLNWFWKRWFFESGLPDLRISKVNLAGKHASVTIEMAGNKPIPINLTVYYSNNTFTHLHQNISCWEKDNKTFTINFTYDLPIKKIVLGDLHDPDVDASNNIFLVK